MLTPEPAAHLREEPTGVESEIEVEVRAAPALAPASMRNVSRGPPQPWGHAACRERPRNEDAQAQSGGPCPGDSNAPEPPPRPPLLPPRKSHSSKHQGLSNLPAPRPAALEVSCPEQRASDCPPLAGRHRGLKHFFKEELRSVVSAGRGREEGHFCAQPRLPRGRGGLGGGDSFSKHLSDSKSPLSALI